MGKKYPVTAVEYSPHEAKKLVDAIRNTPKEETFSPWRLLPFILLIVFVLVTIVLLVTR